MLFLIDISCILISEHAFPSTATITEYIVKETLLKCDISPTNSPATMLTSVMMAKLDAAFLNLNEKM